ncbi:MAG TPA: hypothetical protein VMK84_14330 [Streptosporangiaceae bacterium]|nr:hypothetical protein [Streptosporangiaceae bacterium]
MARPAKFSSPAGTGRTTARLSSSLPVDPAVAASVRRLHQALTAGAGDLERYERLAAGGAAGR